MANQPEQDNVLTKVARTVGSALGTVAGVASEVTGGKSDEAEAAPAKKSKKNAPAADAAERARRQKKAKRAKHKRKLHRKTRG